MLRGAVDYFDGTNIGGWIYSAEVPMRDRGVLAFVDGVCIGAGKVENLRQDLADAGLGDGYCGFNFTISLPDPADAPRVVVRLEASDFALIQRNTKLAGPTGEGAAVQSDKADYSIESIEWMREQNWLDQTGFDFLKHVTTIGIYDRSLRSTGGEMIEPAAEAKRLFELYRQGPVKVQEALIELRNLDEERPNLIDGAAIPVIAVFASAGSLRLLEGSRNERKGGAAANLAGATRHACRGDRLLLLDTRATFAGDSSDTARIFRAV